VLDQRGRLLRAALGFARLPRPSYDRALWALRTWLDSWSGIGQSAGRANVERSAERPPSLRYYRNYYAQMDDGRVFFAGNVKKLEYERGRARRHVAGSPRGRPRRARRATANPS